MLKKSIISFFIVLFVSSNAFAVELNGHIISNSDNSSSSDLMVHQQLQPLLDYLESDLEIARETTDMANIRAAFAEIVASGLSEKNITECETANSITINPCVGEPGSYLYSAFIDLQQNINGWQAAERINTQISDIDFNSFYEVKGKTAFLVYDPGSMKLYAAITDVDPDIHLTHSVYNALSWSKLGYNLYNQGSFLLAGTCYEQALLSNPDNYNYATSASMAYIKAEYAPPIVKLLKTCIELKPEAVEPYLYLISIYFEKNDTPDEIIDLIEQGCKITHDKRILRFARLRNNKQLSLFEFNLNTSMLEKVGMLSIDNANIMNVTDAIYSFQEWINNMRQEDTVPVTGEIDPLTRAYLQYCIENNIIVSTSGMFKSPIQNGPQIDENSNLEKGSNNNYISPSKPNR